MAVSGFRHSGIVWKLWKTEAWFWYLRDNKPFQFEFPRNEKLELFFQGTRDYQNFKSETLLIADHEDVKESLFDWLTAKLWLKESTICGKFALLNEWISTNIEASSCGNIFSANLRKIEIFFSVFVHSDYHCFISQNLKVIGFLGQKFNFFIPLGTQIEIDFHSANKRIQLHSFIALKWYLNDKSLKHGRRTATI